MSFSFNTNSFTNLSSGQANAYDIAWNKYLEIQSYNSNISTLWGNGNRTPAPYKFSGSEEKIIFRNGQMLHQQAYPGSNVNLIRPQ
jgi:hypothetical protein